MNRLKAGKELKEYRENLLEQQGGKDPITDLYIKAPCLDHSHEDGHCRCVLDRGTNSFEGKVWNAYKRYIRHQREVSFPEILRNLAKYHEQSYIENPLHPTWKTPEEKRLKRNKKARLARAKAKLMGDD